MTLVPISCTGDGKDFLRGRCDSSKEGGVRAILIGGVVGDDRPVQSEGTLLFWGLFAVTAVAEVVSRGGDFGLAVVALSTRRAT